MKEDFLQYIWANGLYKQNLFVATSGDWVEILSPGVQNRDSGPDFFQARVRINQLEWVGNVEIHLRNSDWNRHRHYLNSAYDNVILSVVMEADQPIYNSRNREITTIVLRGVEELYAEYCYLIRESATLPACYRRLPQIDKSYLQLNLESLVVERLERKCHAIALMLEETRQDWEECFYRLICRYWGGQVNAEPFQQLAIRLPYRTLLRYADQPMALEALLLGVSGLLEGAVEDEYVIRLKQEFVYLKHKHQCVVMDSGQWKFMRVRPAAFPTLRLALLAAFLQKFNTLLSALLEADDLVSLEELLKVEVSSYWENHYRPGILSPRRKYALGDLMKNVLIINALLPFMFLYGRSRGELHYQEKAFSLLEGLKPEKNYMIKAWKKAGVEAESALQSQALIQLTQMYCQKHRCLECRIGKEVLKARL